MIFLFFFLNRFFRIDFLKNIHEYINKILHNIFNLKWFPNYVDKIYRFLSRTFCILYLYFIKKTKLTFVWRCLFFEDKRYPTRELLLLGFFATIVSVRCLTLPDVHINFLGRPTFRFFEAELELAIVGAGDDVS